MERKFHEKHELIMPALPIDTQASEYADAFVFVIWNRFQMRKAKNTRTAFVKWTSANSHLNIQFQFPLRIFLYYSSWISSHFEIFLNEMYSFVCCCGLFCFSISATRMPHARILLVCSISSISFHFALSIQLDLNDPCRSFARSLSLHSSYFPFLIQHPHSLSEQRYFDCVVHWVGQNPDQ